MSCINNDCSCTILLISTIIHVHNLHIIPHLQFRLLFCLTVAWQHGCHGDTPVTMTLLQHWDTNWEGQFSVPLTSDVLGWELKIHFSTPVSGIQVKRRQRISIDNKSMTNTRTFVFFNLSYER